MPLPDVFYGLVGAAIVAYAVLAGADFGGGIWDLLARGPRKDAQRAAIAHAMGPVWEANHVWLIFAIVVLFSAFPVAYAHLGEALFLPLHVVLLGIALRGAAFVFRGYGPLTVTAKRRFGTVFGAASTVTPFVLGTILGAITSGRVERGVLACFAPMPLAVGALALAMTTYLAAVYLAVETDGELQEDFRRRALIAGTFVVAGAALALPLLLAEAPRLAHELLAARSVLVVTAGVIAALTSGGALLMRQFRLARAATIVQVAALVGGLALAHYPYLVYPRFTVQASAAPASTLRLLLVLAVLGLSVLLPSLFVLFRVLRRPKTHAPAT